MRFLSDWQASIRMYYLFASIETGLIEALDIPRTKADLLERLSVKRPMMLDALLDVGVAIGELAMCGDRFKVKGTRSKALQNDKDEIFTGIVQANVTYYHETFHDAAIRVRGAALADLLGKYGEVIARFSRGAEPFITDFLRRCLPRKRPLRLLEVGRTWPSGASATDSRSWPAIFATLRPISWGHSTSSRCSTTSTISRRTNVPPYSANCGALSAAKGVSCS
jgi:hypothetical protein